MNEADVLKVFRKFDALLTGHFELSSGKHSDTYLQCALVLSDPPTAERLCRELAEAWRAENVQTVVGPALGGVVVAYELARALGCRGIFAERKDADMLLRRGFSLAAGERVLVAEDVVTTGGSALEVARLVEQAGAKLVGVTSLIDRGGGRSFAVRFAALARVEPPLYEPAKCPLCARRVPIDKPGSRVRGLASHGT
ncbi:MAG: orotate phosphoribosyltransferase [Planctomycetota bacterium]